MLTTSQAPKYAYLRKVAVYPLVAISLILVSFRLSSQKPKHKKGMATQYMITMRPDSTTFSDPKTGKKVFSVATRDMPPPPPPAAAPGAPTPPMPPATPESISISKLNGNIDSSSIVIKGMRDGKEITVTVKGSNKNIAPTDQARVVLKPSSGDKIKPLIVIDGVITSDINLNDLNPTTIKSMNVLKGENATTKYAEKGANGVIEITTKKP
jgi:hypothetical protein